MVNNKRASNTSTNFPPNGIDADKLCKRMASHAVARRSRSSPSLRRVEGRRQMVECEAQKCPATSTREGAT